MRTNKLSFGWARVSFVSWFNAMQCIIIIIHCVVVVAIVVVAAAVAAGFVVVVTSFCKEKMAKY